MLDLMKILDEKCYRLRDIIKNVECIEGDIKVYCTKNDFGSDDVRLSSIRNIMFVDRGVQVNYYNDLEELINSIISFYTDLRKDTEYLDVKISLKHEINYLQDIIENLNLL